MTRPTGISLYHQHPFFSIGVPTFKRVELLKSTLSSILAQTFNNYEVIVGNDDINNPLDSGKLGVDDRRVVIINHGRNLGELENMNALLAHAKGRYFTWQFDDDQYDGRFLESVYRALVKYDFPSCVFTSYRKMVNGKVVLGPRRSEPVNAELFSGREFLRRYLTGKIRTMGCTAAYERTYLLGKGGAQKLTSGPFALYSEYLLLIESAAEKEIAFINSSLVYYNVHAESWGNSNVETKLYYEATEELIKRSGDVLRLPSLRDDYKRNTTAIAKMLFQDFAKKSSMASGLSCFVRSKNFFLFVRQLFSDSTDLDVPLVGLFSWIKMVSWFVVPFFKGKAKARMPQTILLVLLWVHAAFQNRS